MKPGTSSPRVAARSLLRRLGRIVLFALVGLYVLGATGGYLFLRYGRKIEEVSFTDVALFRAGAVRRTLARQQFREAQAAWDAKNYQQAYVHFSSALARDPANLKGRLTAARFLASLGAIGPMSNLLEQGLAITPNDRELNEILFTQLTASGRHRHVLELLRGTHASALTGPNAIFLQTVELQATLATAGAPAAKALLQQRSQLRRESKAIPMVARVSWEAGDRAEAVTLLAAYVQSNPGALASHLTLVGWQLELGAEQPAIDSALAAVRQFPGELGPRVLLFDATARRIRGTADWWREIAAYLREFHASPLSMLALSELAGRRGWVEVAGALYELAARRGDDLGLFGLYCSDALARSNRLPEARAMLGEIALQSDDRGVAFLVQLREREVAAAQAAGDVEGVRDSARRLAALLRSDPDRVDLYRDHYRKLGVNDAVTELSARTPAPRRAAPEKPRGS